MVLKDNARMVPPGLATLNRGGGKIVTGKVLVALSGGVPVSVTRIVMVLVLGTGAFVVTQLKAPVVGVMLAPAGAPGSSAKTRLWGG